MLLDILIKIVASVGSVAIVTAISLASKFVATRRKLKQAQATIKEYSNQAEAMDDIKRDFGDSRLVRLMGIRGNTITSSDGELNFLLHAVSKIDGNLMIANPHTDAGKAMIRKRALQMKHNATEDDIHKFHDDVIQSEKILISDNKNDNLECRMFDSPNVFRMMVCDSAAYFAIYVKELPGQKCPMFRAPRGSQLYLMCEEQFKEIWHHKQTKKVGYTKDYNPSIDGD